MEENKEEKIKHIEMENKEERKKNGEAKKVRDRKKKDRIWEENVLE